MDPKGLTPEALRALRALKVGSVVEAGKFLPNVTDETLAFQVVSKVKGEDRVTLVLKAFFADLFVMQMVARVTGDKIEWEQT